MTDDVRFASGLLGMTDAARLLGIPRQTFHRWARGYERGEPLIHVLEETHRARDARVTFIALSEAWVLEGLRQAGVRPRRIRPALAQLQKDFGREYVLAAPELATDGIDVLWDFSRSKAGEGLIAGASGQFVLREIVESYLQYVARAADGYPSILTLKTCEPSKVVIDPRRSFGQPFFEGARVRIADVASMLKAGEDPEVVAREYGVSEEDVRNAARVLLGRAA